MTVSAFPIGGVQWTTLADYPGKVATTVFTIGCNFRCPFCHNPELVDAGRFPPALDEEEILGRLRERTRFIDGVVISGGEPTIHSGLRAFVKSLRMLGLVVKLDTNGALPNVLRPLLEERRLDFVAMDVKAPLDAYDRLGGIVSDVDAIEESIRLILDRAPDYEFRTTVAPSLSRADVLRVAERIAGAKRYVLQTYRVSEKGLLDPAWKGKRALSRDELDALWDEIRSGFEDGGVRG